MWKRVVLVALCVTLLSCCPTAYAAEARAVDRQVTLNFDGDTAICEYYIASPGKSIYVKMQLWRGSALIASWNESGTNVVSLERSCPVLEGQTYTLKVSGTCGGEAIRPTSITKTCPKN